MATDFCTCVKYYIIEDHALGCKRSIVIYRPDQTACAKIASYRLTRPGYAHARLYHSSDLQTRPDQTGACRPEQTICAKRATDQPDHARAPVVIYRPDQTTCAKISIQIRPCTHVRLYYCHRFDRGVRPVAPSGFAYEIYKSHDLKIAL